MKENQLSTFCRQLIFSVLECIYEVIFSMQTKTSIRFFNKKAVRARWDDSTNSWWYAATDIIDALEISSNSRIYWNTFKKRHIELLPFCRQLKLTAQDGKKYNTDCINQAGIDTLFLLLPAQSKLLFLDWIKGMNDPIDERSKKKAYELYGNSILDTIEVGTIKGLQQIHAYLFEGLYDFAGKIRNKNISKNGFVFANCMYFDSVFEYIEKMPENTIDEIVDKYIEANIAHPFMEGNGRATRIWLDNILKARVKKCIDWEKIDKKEYLSAMEKSPVDSQPIKKLIETALTEKITDREIFMKGIDYSYYYETEDE